MHGIDPVILPHLLAIAAGKTESVAFIFLNKGGAALGLHHMPSTSASRVDVSLRTVTALAMAHDSQDVMMAHNHPSGDPDPSAEDLRTTRRLAAALDALGIRLVDHLVLAAGASVSFRARGLL